MKQNFQELRHKIKKSQRKVMELFLFDQSAELCFFCGSQDNLTKEHMLPQWVFDKNPGKYFSATVNNLPQTYIHATIPACSRCNNVLLSSLEAKIISILDSTDPTDYGIDERDLIIWWLESIGFKLQILDLRTRFLRQKTGPYIPFLANIPLGIMRRGGEEPPHKILSDVRRARRRLIRKSKNLEENSLVIFKTSNPDMHFFHKSGELIFLELPKYQVAFFHFYEKDFQTKADARKAAMEIIENVY